MIKVFKKTSRSSSIYKFQLFYATKERAFPVRLKFTFVFPWLVYCSCLCCCFCRPACDVGTPRAALIWHSLGRQAGRQPAGKLYLSSPLSVSPLARLPLQLLQGNISPATTTTSATATARARATVPTTTRSPFYVAALMALYYWQSSSTRYARKRWRCSTTANLYGNRCARHIFNADFSILSSNPLSRRKSM